MKRLFLLSLLLVATATAPVAAQSAGNSTEVDPPTYAGSIDQSTRIVDYQYQDGVFTVWIESDIPTVLRRAWSTFRFGGNEDPTKTDEHPGWPVKDHDAGRVIPG
jgi:hypothetical protein